MLVAATAETASKFIFNELRYTRAAAQICGVYFAFIAYNAASVFWSPPGSVAMQDLGEILSLCIPAFFLATVVAQSQESTVRFMIGLVIGGFIGALHVMIWFHSPTADLQFVFSSIGGYQGLNRMLGMGAIATLVLMTYRASRWWQIVFLSGLLIASIVEMTLIGGRGAFLSFFFCAFLFFAFRVDFDRVHLLRLTPRTIFFVLGLGVFVLLIVGISLVDASMLPRSLSRIDALLRQINASSSSNLASSQSRLYLWNQSLEVWGLHPWFGCGLGSWGLLTGGIDLAGDYAHNFLLQALSELGLLGFGLFVLPFYLLVRNLLEHWRSLPREALSLCLLLAIFSFMQAMVTGNLTDFWTYAGVGLLFIGVNFRVET